MSSKALVVIDIQNDITKHYRDIIDNINVSARDRAFYISCRNLNQAANSMFGLRIQFLGGATAVLSE
jgi:hypothetical protein